MAVKAGGGVGNVSFRRGQNWELMSTQGLMKVRARMGAVECAAAGGVGLAQLLGSGLSSGRKLQRGTNQRCPEQ